MSAAATLPTMSALLAAPAKPEASVFDQQPSRPVKFLTSGITPPADLYLSADDSIQVDVLSATAGLNTSVSIRLLRTDGTITIEEESITTVALPATATARYRLAEGFLLSVMVRATTLNTIRGQIFATVSFIRSFGSTPTVTYTLVQGYVTTISRVSWPILQPDWPTNGQGNLVTHLVTAPGAGANVVFTQSTALRWRLLAGAFLFTTSATVITRNIEVQLQNAGNFVADSWCPFGQAASAAQQYVITPGIPAVTGTPFVPNVAWPTDLRMQPGTVLIMTVVNFQAGDAFTNIVLQTEEWVDT